jgi:hypothetical protein
VARAGGGAKQGLSAGNRADENDVGDGDGRLGEVAAGQRDFVSGGEGKQAIEEVLDPGGFPARGYCQLARQAEGKKGGDGTGAHGGQVAETTRQNPMADGFRLMPVEAEVAAGDGEVSGDGQFLATARAEQGAVVADAKTEGAQGGLRRTAADLAKQGQFTRLGFADGLGWLGWHFLRIGQMGLA